jgi:hypothetical protein
MPTRPSTWPGSNAANGWRRSGRSPAEWPTSCATREPAPDAPAPVAEVPPDPGRAARLAAQRERARGLGLLGVEAPIVEEPRVKDLT